MKLISLKFKAFGAYLDEQYIDFTSLSKAGLFLISGKTGAGKTIILDAITYALYGKSSGGNRGDIYAMRCQFAAPKDDTEVELVFEIRGNRYKFTRKLQQKRINIASSQNALFMADDGGYMPFFENPHLRDVEQKATELIGLNYEQFRQVIILPQGQFEKLLVAKSDEKEKILVSLFGAQKWQKAAEAYYELANERKKTLDSVKLQLDNILRSRGCNSILELENLSSNKKAEYTKALENEKLLSKQYKKLNAEAEKLYIIAEKFRNIEELNSKQEIIDNLADEITADSIKIERCLNASKLKPVYDKAKVSEQELERREQDLKLKKDVSDSTGLKLEEVRMKLAKLNSHRNEIAENKNQIMELESLKTVVETIDSLTQQLKNKEDEYAQHRGLINILEKSIKKLGADRDKAENDVLEKYSEYNLMLTEYLNGMSGSLAKELKENSPCPVCGSTHHPNPAKICEIAIDQMALERKNSELENTKKRRDEIKAEFEFSESNLKSEQSSLNDKLLEIEKDRAVIDNMRDGVNYDINNLQELQEQIHTLQIKIQEYEAELSDAEASCTMYESQLIAQKAALEIAEKEYHLVCQEAAEAKREFETTLEEYSFSTVDEYISYLISDKQLCDLQKKIADYEIEKNHVKLRLDELTKAVDGVKKPEIDSMRTQLKALENELLEARGNSTLLLSEIQNIDATISDLKTKFKNYIIEEEQNNKDIIFAKRMRGDSGIGIQRYLLGVVLSQVTSEANRLLENVHNGRYRLLRTLEGSGSSRKTGLELEVYDSFTGERRGVATLSGGEKFLVSLSLSIGLSTVVQSESSGISIETMFIDEGFGSLDPASIADALNVLGKMKNSGSLIGIISHVEALKDNITTQLEIKKERGGSKIVMHV